MKDNFQTSLLYSALKTLDNQGIKDFDLYLNSPFFNKNKELIDFWKLLRRKMAQSSKTQISKKNLFAALYPVENFKDSKIRLMMSDLYSHFENYLIHSDSKLSTQKSNNVVIKYYRENGLEKHFVKKLKSIHRENEKSHIKNEQFFTELSNLSFQNYLFEYTRKRSSIEALQDCLKNTDYSLILIKLNQACTLAAYSAVYKTEIEIEFLEEVLTFVEKNNLESIPAIAIYYNCYKLHQEGGEGYFPTYQKLLKEHIHVLNPEETRDIFLMGINYCIRLINKGNAPMSEPLLKLFEIGLEGDHLLVNGVLSRYTYRNIVTVGLISKDYEWVEKFIFDYKPKLDLKYRESMFTLNLAILKYEQKVYDEVLDLLHQYESKDLLLNLFGKTILLKVYYIQNSHKLLDSHLDAMEVFIRRKKIIGYHRTNYMNIIKYTRKLIKLNPYDHSAKAKLHEEVQNAENIAEKKWLLEKLSE